MAYPRGMPRSSKLSWLGFWLKKVVVSESYVGRNGNTIMLDKNVQLQTYGKVWIVGGLEEKTMHDFAWRFLAESVIENQSNLGSAITLWLSKKTPRAVGLH